MNKFGVILYSPWRADGNSDGIVGTWAEDGSNYFLTVPPQLRDMIVAMQNELSKFYCETEDTKRCLAERERFARIIFTGVDGG